MGRPTPTETPDTLRSRPDPPAVSGPQDHSGAQTTGAMRQLRPTGATSSGQAKPSGEGTGGIQGMARGTASTAQATERGTKAAAQPAQTHRHAGPYGASFDGTEPDGKTPVKGLTFERRWTRPGVHPYDEITWELRTAGIANETRQDRLRAEGRRGPRLLEPARHQRRRQQVLPRPHRHAGARDQRQAAHRPRRQHDRGLGRDPALLRDRRGPRRLPGRADPPARPPEDGVQLAGLVQRRHRGEAAVLGLLHQLGPGHDVLDHGPRQDRGHALQVRLGRRLNLSPIRARAREDVGRRHRLAARSAS